MSGLYYSIILTLIIMFCYSRPATSGDGSKGLKTTITLRDYTLVIIKEGGGSPMLLHNYWIVGFVDGEGVF